MNLNDLRASAYKNASKNDDAPRTIKAFSPPRITKNTEKKQTEPPEKKDELSANEKPFFSGVNRQVGAILAAEKKSGDPTGELERAAHSLTSHGLVKVPVKSGGDGKDTVYRRVAKFLLLIGVDEAAKIIPHLTEAQTERIIPEIASIRSVTPEESSIILEEFRSLLEKSRESGGMDTARNILEKAYGPERAQKLLEKAAPFAGAKPFDYLNDADSERVLQLLSDESPSTRALVISRIEPKKAAAVINLMNERDKTDVIFRLAKLQPVAPDILRRVDQAMREKSLTQTSGSAENIDGRNVLAEILKKMPAGTENGILASLENEDPALGEDLRSRLFTFDDVVNADDRYIQDRLREMSDIDIALLTAGKPSAFRDKILSCISAGRRAHVRYEAEASAPLLKKDCVRVTDAFMSVLRRAYETGALKISTRDDEYVL
ncbi:MAG: flagellar motor switch protein FliG [Treponema sp.]